MLDRVIVRTREYRLGLLLVASSWAACNTYDPGLLVGLSAAQPAPEAGASGESSSRAAGEAREPNGSAAGASVQGGSAGSAGSAASGDDAGSAGEAAVAGSPGGGGNLGAGGVSPIGGGATLASELIDDFEDQDGLLLPLQKRNGPWYVFSDATKTGTLSPLTISLVASEPSNPGSASALHLTAKGFTDWGAGVGADFVNLAGKKVAYNVSAYGGIRFYAKAAKGTQSTLKLLLPTIYSDAQGGKCSDLTVDKRCSDHLFCSMPGLGTGWAEYTCRFSDLVQQGFGLPQAALDPTSVYSLQFTVSTKALAADVWIDDVSFVGK